MIKDKNQRKFYEKHKEKRNKNSLDYFYSNKEKRLKYQKDYIEKKKLENLEEFTKKRKEYNQKSHNKSREKMNETNKVAARKRRQVVLSFYGGNPPKCQCCGEQEYRFLTIDHMNNDGTNHRRELGINSSTDLYIWLIHSDFPKEFQVLCMNCNFGKRMNDGICPHKDLDSIKRYLTFNKKRKYDNLAKLTKEDAADIKIRLTKGESVLSIASKYKLSSKTIKLIKSNRLWVNIPWPEN